MVDINIDESKIDFKIDDEFRSYLPSLKEKEYQELKKSIKREGCREPLIIWDEKNSLVDGHHRLSICQESSKGYDIKRKSFQFRAQVIAWIVENQLGQRNLNEKQYDYYRGKRYRDESKTHGGDRKSSGQNVHMKTAEKIAREENTNEKTVRRNAKFSESVDKISKNVGSKFRTIALSENSPFSKGATKEIDKLDKNTQKQIVDIVNSGKSLTKKDIEKIKDLDNAEKGNVLNKINNGEAHDIASAVQKIEQGKKRKEFTKKAKRFDPSKGFNIYQGNFQEISKKFDDESFDHIVTDPPYGKKYVDLWDDLGKTAKRVLKPSGFLVSMSGQLTLPDALRALSEYLNYYWTISYVVPDKSPIVPLWEKKIKVKWKPVIVFYKEPENKQFDTIEDMIHGSGNIKDKHEWEQPVDDTEKLIEMFTNPGDKILDPMAGSGTTLVAAKNKKRECVGIEKEEKYIDIIKGRLA